MSTPQIEDDDELLSADRSYAYSIKTALIFLLLGGSLLAAARFLWLGASEVRLLVARIAEILGWGSLASSTAVLSAKWRNSRIHPRHRPGRYLWSADEASRISVARDRLLRIAPAGDESERRADAIDKLYAELRPLMSRAAADPSLNEEVQVKLSQLRRLQSEEADEMEKRFEAGLLLKPGEGWKALNRADEILARYENSSSPDASTERKN